MFRVLPPTFEQIRLQDFFVGGKTPNIAIQLVLQQLVLQNNLHDFCRPFYRTFE